MTNVHFKKFLRNLKNFQEIFKRNFQEIFQKFQEILKHFKKLSRNSKLLQNYHASVLKYIEKILE